MMSLAQRIVFQANRKESAPAADMATDCIHVCKYVIYVCIGYIMKNLTIYI